MENAVDALKMAGSILLFIIALSVTLNAFGQARETSDVILSYKDRETEYIEGDYYYKSTGNDADKVRQVGLETVIPSIYRAVYENYRIIFIFKNGDNNPIYTTKTKENNNIVTNNIYFIDTDSNINGQVSLTGDTYENGIKIPSNKPEFINGVLYGKYKNNRIQDFKKSFGMDEIYPLYNRLYGKEITEYLGVYYHEDANIKVDATGNIIEIPEANKDEKRVITYVVK